ncbi:hypothetical protein CspeluHIS016_0200430 [Cutaneotrichosporon spelunceum]|uniref:HPP transmembrane region domain-containing protein n=1 Tax=Cutaneotrichosporon spelunceum TaxID=1672016 RepID=A0AAD3TR65_9TREE|nr:hypothetical protein CspeluHIS016_0200430 [Cutaneotrichosporon spelunceum]
MASNGIARPAAAVHRNGHVSMDAPYTNGNGHVNGNGHAAAHPTWPLQRKSSAATSTRNHAPFTWHRDMREYLPPVLRRFFGYREPGTKAPFEPLPFPPFTWIARLPLKYEVWFMSFIASFVGIALIEIVMIAAFPNEGVIMIVASFGASAVLTFATIDSPLAQPRHLVGGQVVSAIAGVAITRCFRHATGYHLEETTSPDGLQHVVWINGALAMAAALLAMQITGTTHPPGGATALIASVMPSGVAMSWRLVYIVIISGLLMLGWAMIINNAGRRRYPTYWFSGHLLFVKATHHRITQDELHMAAVEGRSDGFSEMDRALSNPVPDEEKLHRRPSLASLTSYTSRRQSRSRSNSPQRSWSPHITRQDTSRMAALEGRNDGFSAMDRALSGQSTFAAIDRTLSGQSGQGSTGPTRTWSRQTLPTFHERANEGFAPMDRVMSQLSGQTVASPPRDRDRDRDSASVRDSVVHDDGF